MYVRWTPMLKPQRSSRRRIVLGDRVEVVLDDGTAVDISAIVQAVAVRAKKGSVAMLYLDVTAWELGEQADNSSTSGALARIGPT